MEAENGLLNIESLMRNCLLSLSRGQPCPVLKIEKAAGTSEATIQTEPAVIFDVVTLRQTRLQSLLEELEKRRVPWWVRKEIHS
mmetsp:Transcript_28510/g.35210  ORF Transcript_28510/g.35210 Transcript_28510/m.35210 type:complete len:84 (-) Transcript_28510:1852-2103(-)